MGNGLTNIGDLAFANCFQLAGLFFASNAPSVGPLAFEVIHHTQEGPFASPESATVYFLANTTGWSNTFAGLPTVMLARPPQFGATGEGWSYMSDQVKFTFVIGYQGTNQAVVIPSLINGLPVTGIGSRAFSGTALSSVTIPESMTSIGSAAFEDCTNLASIIIPDSVASIGEHAFAGCDELIDVFFTGNAPTADWSVFGYDPVTVYYLPGTTGWDDFSANAYVFIAPWLLPQPLILNHGPGFGLQSGPFGFTISWATNVPVVVEACANLSNPNWIPVATNTLTGGTSYFSDSQWTNFSSRFYRLRSP